MPELAGLLLRRSLTTLQAAESRCAKCRRTPLPGERLHELDSGRELCELCFAALPEPNRVAVRTERIGSGAGRLTVVPKAA